MCRRVRLRETNIEKEKKGERKREKEREIEVRREMSGEQR